MTREELEQKVVNEKLREVSDANPAFPLVTSISVGEVSKVGVIAPGLSKRELLAALAMQGLSADSCTIAEHLRVGKVQMSITGFIAQRAVAQADALLAELKCTEKPLASSPPPQEGST